MKQKRRIYTAEFRQEARRLLEGSGKGVSAIEQELGRTRGRLYQWPLRYGQQARASENGTVKASRSELAAAIRRLKRENALVLEEREILKKP